MKNTAVKYLKIWWMMTLLISQTAFASRIGIVLFVIGKLLRFLFFLFFLTLLGTRLKALAHYTLIQMIFIFLTFNLVDISAQFFLREVYRFRDYVVRGTFDYILTKPFSPLFRILFGGSDVIDLITFVPLIAGVIYVATKLGAISPAQIVLYLLLMINAFLIALAFHIFVVALGVITTEVDNAIWIFRDLTQLGRIPVDLYREPVSFIFTFLLPVGVMVTFPARALFGLLAPEYLAIAFGISCLLLFLSIKGWKYAINNYTSASS